MHKSCWGAPGIRPVPTHAAFSEHWHKDGACRPGVRHILHRRTLPHSGWFYCSICSSSSTLCSTESTIDHHPSTGLGTLGMCPTEGHLCSPPCWWAFIEWSTICVGKASNSLTAQHSFTQSFMLYTFTKQRPDNGPNTQQHQSCVKSTSCEQSPVVQCSVWRYEFSDTEQNKIQKRQ